MQSFLQFGGYFQTFWQTLGLLLGKTYLGSSRMDESLFSWLLMAVLAPSMNVETMIKSALASGDLNRMFGLHRTIIDGG